MKSNKQQENAFLKVYDKHADDIYRHCFFRLFHEELAKEYMQEAFLRCWQVISEKEVKNIRALVYKIANNLIIDYSRKQKEESLEKRMESGWEPSEFGKKEMENSVDAQYLLEISKQIPEEFRSVLLMRYVDGLKPKEIAEILGEDTNLISVRIHRGKSALKKLVAMICILLILV
ncbi:MAG: hypothetical protein COV59_00300 [Candidatus Magasanikbacteria bacterium CG11_big_fil_rev_8_21_14_0_20_39_34]|uniref:RNA polymerase sigma factor 70 region 4 type 2 domain-containing protein n=1 Tax=Candidatus Magasanikbacteria bacterium CG11_big_fil_rev_8_21_14_0_20_39_34 TaxID=1974653 RepID=A0A2H0N6N4_9BACT|nr:MAG: hypothetical protein COV59_00300 [Candidatus Magasanikbacteria bacterium CG11_big_fil_rev_8_21_14_0_20_39_34]